MATMPSTPETVKLPDGEKATVSYAPGITNWRTLIVNGLIVVVPALVAYLAGINWSDYLSPVHASWMVVAINIAMRFISNGPAGSNVQVKMVTK